MGELQVTEGYGAFTNPIILLESDTIDIRSEERKKKRKKKRGGWP